MGGAGPAWGSRSSQKRKLGAGDLPASPASPRELRCTKLLVLNSFFFLVTASRFTFRFQVSDMFMWLVQPSLEFIRLQCKFVVQTSPIHLAFSMMRLYSCLLGKSCERRSSQTRLAADSAPTPTPGEWHFGLPRTSQSPGSVDKAWWKECTYFGFSLDLGLMPGVCIPISVLGASSTQRELSFLSVFA